VKKTTTTKKAERKRKLVHADKPVDDKPVEKKWRVQSKAGMLTYNRVEIENHEDLVDMYKELKVKFSDTIFSLCLEKESRFHVHLFFEKETPFDCDLQYFVTSKSGPVDDCSPNRGKNIAQGHFYVQCEFKKSHITCFFDKKICNPAEKWLMDWWKCGKIEKITEALAAYKLLKPQLQLQISANQDWEEKMKIQKEIVERDERLNSIKEEFAVIPRVMWWQSSFKVEDFRYSFLVLCGASRLRKTEYAKSLFKNPFIHKDKIDWTGYSWSENGCIIFDDVNLPDHIWKYVRQNKVMFQSSSIVAVNTSATNCYKRDVCVVQKPIIICTNDALLEPFVSAPYREWIQANSVWIDVTEPIAFKDSIMPLAYNYL